MNDNVAEEKKKILIPKSTLYIRIVVGAYLVYQAYLLINGVKNNENDQGIYFLIFQILFVLIGVFLMLNTGIKLIKGQYAGGAADEHPQTQTAEHQQTEAIAEAEIMQEDEMMEAEIIQEDEQKEV